MKSNTILYSGVELLDNIIVENISGIIPSDIANLGVWLDSLDLSTLWQDTIKTNPASSFGDPIGNWEDKSSNGRDAIQGTTADKPTREINGITADGVTDHLGITVSAGTLQTIILVAKNLGATNNRRLWGWDTNATLVFNLGSLEWRYSVNEALGSVDLNQPSDVLTVLSFRYASTSSLKFDSNTQSFAAFDPNDTFNTISNFGLFARNFTGSNPINAEIVEVVAYERAITDSELTQLMSYLVGRWGL